MSASTNKILDTLLKSVVTDLVNNNPEMSLMPSDEEQTRLNTKFANWKQIPTLPIEIKKQKPNEVCKCGSGKKYKKCCRLTVMKGDLQREIQYELQEKNERAVKLYNNSVREGLKLINPDEYFQRQSINRALFEGLRPMVESHYSRDELEATTTYKYFKCMYEDWPAWMDYVINYFNTNSDTDDKQDAKPDIAEIYYNLTKI